MGVGRGAVAREVLAGDREGIRATVCEGGLLRVEERRVRVDLHHGGVLLFGREGFHRAPCVVDRVVDAFQRGHGGVHRVRARQDRRGYAGLGGPAPAGRSGANVGRRCTGAGAPACGCCGCSCGLVGGVGRPIGRAAEGAELEDGGTSGRLDADALRTAVVALPEERPAFDALGEFIAHVGIAANDVCKACSWSENSFNAPSHGRLRAVAVACALALWLRVSRRRRWPSHATTPCSTRRR